MKTFRECFFLYIVYDHLKVDKRTINTTRKPRSTARNRFLNAFYLFLSLYYSNNLHCWTLQEGKRILLLFVSPYIVPAVFARKISSLYFTRKYSVNFFVFIFINYITNQIGIYTHGLLFCRTIENRWDFRHNRPLRDAIRRYEKQLELSCAWGVGPTRLDPVWTVSHKTSKKWSKMISYISSTGRRKVKNWNFS